MFSCQIKLQLCVSAILDSFFVLARLLSESPLTLNIYY